MKRKSTPSTIQSGIFRSHLILIIVLALILFIAGITLNLRSETRRRDQNLQNVAESVAHSGMVTGSGDPEDITAYLDSLESTLSEVDVLSVVDADGIRRYHTNHELIGKAYDGTLPDFSRHTGGVYAENNVGPSGQQRRAYASITDPDGTYKGFVIAIMLEKNIRAETLRLLLTFLSITAVAILLEVLISGRLSARIKDKLMGYEPDSFSSMYKIRDNTLESLEEGIISVNERAEVEYINRAAERMLGTENKEAREEYGRLLFSETVRAGKPEFNVRESCFRNADVIVDRIPVREQDRITGAVAILHDRTEYTKLMEDLSGTRYLVDSMRANNHDFTNKLHVILGLIQMGLYDQATAYIENITIVQREMISSIMHCVDDSSVAALLIGKVSRSSECDVRFTLREGSCFNRADMPVPSDSLVTIIGNLIDNALDAMNIPGMEYPEEKELLFGIFSRPGALLITVDDTGSGITEENISRIYENGFSTKGAGRGTGLWHTKQLIDSLGGEISVHSQQGEGTSFTVSFRKNAEE